MSLGVVLVSGILGFIVTIAAGLVFGLGFLACMGVYSGVGVTTALSMFTLRGLWCAAARRLAESRTA
jgi:hypothetical protein